MQSEDFNNYIETIKQLSEIKTTKTYTIRYFFLADKPAYNVFGYSIDLGSYTTKEEAEKRITELVVQTGHTRFYIIESGKWVPLSTNSELMKVHIGKLGKNGAELLEHHFESKMKN